MDTTTAGDENSGEIPMDIGEASGGAAESGHAGRGGESSSSPDFPWPFGSGRDSGSRATGKEEPLAELTLQPVSFMLCFDLSWSTSEVIP